KLQDSLRSSLSSVDGLDPEQNCVPVPTIERPEKSLRWRVPGERCLQVVRNAGPARRVVRSPPSTVRFRTLDLGESGWFHFAVGNERQPFLSIPLRPEAPLLPGSKLHQPVPFVFALCLTVNPSVTQRFVKSIAMRDRLKPRSFLGQPQPCASCAAVMSGQP